MLSSILSALLGGAVGGGGALVLSTFLSGKRITAIEERLDDAPALVQELREDVVKAFQQIAEAEQRKEFDMKAQMQERQMALELQKQREQQMFELQFAQAQQQRQEALRRNAPFSQQVPDPAGQSEDPLAEQLAALNARLAQVSNQVMPR
jgi:chromosome segregation ATPase